MKAATVLALLAVAGCATAGARRFQHADRAAIASVLEAQRAAWNRGDLAAYMRGYARSPDLVFTSGGQIRRGWDGRWRLTGTPNAGSGVFSVALERRPEGWLILHDHTSRD